ncbi:MAG: RHS repeat-associated core domain-containing protein, partial [Planctomycetota bacterium]
EDILLEYDGANVLQARYTHGIGIDEPLIMERGGQSYFYGADGLGSISQLTDGAGAVAQSYIYNSFGKIVKQTGTLVNPYTYTGREYDSESGLYYYRARYYDATTGRFLQQDPVGFLGGINFYSYVFSSPINYIDPTGTVVETVFDVISTAMSAYEFATCPSIGSLFNLLLDVGGLIIPGVPSLGTVKRGTKILGIADNANDLKTLKRFTPDQDALIQLAKEVERRGVTKEEASTLLEWAEEYGVKPALDHIGTTHWSGGPHIRIGPVSHIPIR